MQVTPIHTTYQMFKTSPPPKKKLTFEKITWHSSYTSNLMPPYDHLVLKVAISINVTV